MKIAYFLDLPNGFGGAGNLLLKQAFLMSELHEVVIVLPVDKRGNYNQEYVMRCEHRQLPYVCIEYSTFYNFHMLVMEDYYTIMKSAVYIENFVEKEKITFFHSVQLNMAVEFVSRKLKIPHLMDIYQIQEYEFKICPGDMYPPYHLCDSLIYCDRWNTFLGVESRCVRPIAILDHMKKKNTYVKNKITVLMLGDVSLRKNQLTAIKAIEQCLGLAQIELQIAGGISSDYAKECITYVREHGLEQSVFFHGFVSDITPLLETSDCLLCTSIDESFPSSFVEALTYDLTIISTPVAGVPEVFVDRENSFISKNFSVDAIKESILDCLDYYLSGAISVVHESAEKTWKENFEQNTVRKQIDAYYRDIMSNAYFKDINSFLKIEEEIKQTKVQLCGLDDGGEQWIYNRLWYYTVLGKMLCKEKIYIWGAGKFGKLAFQIIKRVCQEVTIEVFVDTNKEGMFLGIPIIHIDDMPVDESCFYSISFAHGKKEAIHYLESKGLELNRQIWNIP